MNLHFQIENKEDIDYLKKKDGDKLNNILRSAITIGLKSIQMSEVNMDCHSYVDPIKDLILNSNETHVVKLFDIESKLNDILHIKSNSSRKGRLSEDICRDILTKYYPSWSFIDVSQEGYEADCRAYETPVGQILYEFKNYDHNVNRDQVSKFVRDLNHTNIQYGIFVSNTSGIVGKKNIEWEIVDDKLVIYVSSMGFNGYGCIIGTELLLSLIEIGVLNKDKNWLYYQNFELNGVLENISGCIDKLRNNIESYTKHKQLISDQRIKINHSIDILEKNAFDCLLGLNHTMEEIINDTKNIKTSHKILEDLFDKTKFLEQIKNERYNILFQKIIGCCHNSCHEYNIKSNNNDILVFSLKTLICYTKTLKSKIELIFPIYQKKINLNLEYEKIKNNEIYIELRDDISIWNLIVGTLK